jgi:LacI family transcriptional regulator
MNGRGQLKEETRKRVLAAAEQLGFTPNLMAKSLLSGRTYTVGILTTDSIGRFTIPILTGAEDALGAGQMSLLLCESRGDPIREQHYLRILLARRVDGIIVTGRSSDMRPSIGRDIPVPVVYALVQSEDPNDLSILHDDGQGAFTAVEHLLATGRRKIAIVAGPIRHSATQHRVDGAERALSTAGVSTALGGPLYGEWSEQWGREAAIRLIKSDMEVDGVFCASDQIARGVADGFRENGLDVPRQVGIVGVDNWDVMAAASRPPLTTIDLNLAEIGHVAATRLLSAIDGHLIGRGVEYVASSLVKRRSTEID